MRLELQGIPAATQSEDYLDAKSVHPAAGAAIPGPAAAHDMGRHAVDIGGNHIRLHPITRHLPRPVAVIDGIDQPEEGRGQIAVTQFGNGPDRSQRPVGILTAILAKARQIPFAITQVVTGPVKWG